MKVENFEPKEYARRNKILNSKSITYQEFLKSPKWEKARERIFKRDGKLCRICKSTKNLNVHHNNYNERNLSGGIRCLVVLCNICHNEVHKIAKQNGWYYKKVVKSLTKRFKKYGDIFYYAPKKYFISSKKNNK